MKEKSWLHNWVGKIDLALCPASDCDQAQQKVPLIELWHNMFQLVLREWRFHVTLSYRDGVVSMGHNNFLLRSY